MKHLYLCCLLLALLTIDSGVVKAQNKLAPIAIHSVTVQLPVSQSGFPPGPGSESSGKCLICHSAGMVLKQPLLSEAQWKAEINKMRNAYGAPIDEDEVDSLAAYMSKVNAEQQSH